MTDNIKIDVITLMRTLLDSARYQRQIDYAMSKSLHIVVESLRCDFLICGFGDNGETQSLLTTNCEIEIEKVLNQISSFIENKFGERSLASVKQTLPIKVSDASGLLIPVPGNWVDEYGVDLDIKSTNFVFFGNSNRKSIVQDPDDSASMEQFAIIARTICMIFERRSELYSRFPRKFSDAYWESAVDAASGRIYQNQKQLWTPPWNYQRQIKDNDGPLINAEQGRRSTVTLSFDLRRSTRAMERAGNSKDFADWVEGMVMILHRLAIHNNGVFDKFTGDGALVHFLEKESRKFRIPRASLDGFDNDSTEGRDWRSHEKHAGHYAAADALACSFEMIEAVNFHSKRLMQIVGMHDWSFGPVAAVAKGIAQWSVDRDGNPIVVGDSVVQACRFGDNAKKCEVLASPHIHHLMFEANVGLKGKLKPFKSKETGAKDRFGVFTYKSVPTGLSRPTSDIHDVVKSIQNEMDRRSKEAKSNVY